MRVRPRSSCRPEAPPKSCGGPSRIWSCSYGEARGPPSRSRHAQRALCQPPRAARRRAGAADGVRAGGAAAAGRRGRARAGSRGAVSPAAGPPRQPSWGSTTSCGAAAGRSTRSIDAGQERLERRQRIGSRRGAAAQADAVSVGTFAAFERRIGDSGAIDEHALRALLLSSPLRRPYRHIILCVRDQAADARGLWPADFDLLTRLPGLLHLDVVATEHCWPPVFHQRLHDALPGMDEDRPIPEAVPPALIAAGGPEREAPSFHFVCRDREEELVDAARWIQASREAGQPRDESRRCTVPRSSFNGRCLTCISRDRSWARRRFPYQAADALPLAAEPLAAAIDLIFAVVNEEATRASLVELLASPQWSFADPADPDRPSTVIRQPRSTACCRQSKYLGGWERLRLLAGSVSAPDRFRDSRGGALAAGRARDLPRPRPRASTSKPSQRRRPRRRRSIGCCGFVAQHERAARRNRSGA